MLSFHTSGTALDLGNSTLHNRFNIAAPEDLFFANILLFLFSFPNQATYSITAELYKFSNYACTDLAGL